MEIFKKLFEVKSKIGKISKDSNNPFFNSKYFDVNALLENVEPLLHENNLILLQPIQNNKVRTEIADVETGELVFSEMDLPALSDPQKLGSAITYYRRYTLQSLLGIQAEDDDANKASGKAPEKELNGKSKVDHWMTESEFMQAQGLTSDMLKKALLKYSGAPYKDGKTYSMKKEYRTKLNQLANK